MSAMPQSVSTTRPDSPERFTLAQALAVFVAAGVLAHVAARWVVQPLRDRVEATQREQLQGRADAALQRLGTDLRTAAPQAARVGEAGLRLEIRRADDASLAWAGGLQRVAFGALSDARPAPERLVYRCNLADGTLTREASRTGRPADADDDHAELAVVHGVTACHFSQQQDDLIQVTLSLSAAVSATRATVTRQHTLSVGSGA